MSIFKFTTTKPSASKIWTTLMETTISPREGYSEDQIRYRMFIYLQLDSDFRTILARVNNMITNSKTSLVGMLSDTCTLASCSEQNFSDLSVASEAFPHWVEPELYTPYYLTKMLCGKIDRNGLLNTLFDRDTRRIEEDIHISIDQGGMSGLTAYKLYNSTTADEALQYITISYDRTPRPVMSKTEMHISIRDQLMHSIEVSDNHIIPENAKTTIPYFILKASDASQ